MADNRLIIYSFDFLMHATYYGPINKGGDVIKRVQTDFHVANGSSNVFTLSEPTSERVTVQAGLLANGSPTTNSAASVALSEIFIDSDYGFASNTFSFDPPVYYSPSTGTDNVANT